MSSRSPFLRACGIFSALPPVYSENLSESQEVCVGLAKENEKKDPRLTTGGLSYHYFFKENFRLINLNNGDRQYDHRGLSGDLVDRVDRRIHLLTRVALYPRKYHHNHKLSR